MKVRSKFCGHNVKSWFFILVQFCLFFRIFQALDNVALRRMESRSDGCSATELAVEHYERGEVRIWGRKIKRWRVSRESQHCCIHSLRIEKQAPLGDGNLAVTFMRWFLEEIVNLKVFIIIWRNYLILWNKNSKLKFFFISIVHFQRHSLSAPSLRGWWLLRGLAFDQLCRENGNYTGDQSWV